MGARLSSRSTSSCVIRAEAKASPVSLARTGVSVWIGVGVGSQLAFPDYEHGGGVELAITGDPWRRRASFDHGQGGPAHDVSVRCDFPGLTVNLLMPKTCGRCIRPSGGGVQFPSTSRRTNSQ